VEHVSIYIHIHIYILQNGFCGVWTTYIYIYIYIYNLARSFINGLFSYHRSFLVASMIAPLIFPLLIFPLLLLQYEYPAQAHLYTSSGQCFRIRIATAAHSPHSSSCSSASPPSRQAQWADFAKQRLSPHAGRSTLLAPSFAPLKYTCDLCSYPLGWGEHSPHLRFTKGGRCNSLQMSSVTVNTRSLYCQGVLGPSIPFPLR
jgi:hypothetical protein